MYQFLSFLFPKIKNELVLLFLMTLFILFMCIFYFSCEQVTSRCFWVFLDLTTDTPPLRTFTSTVITFSHPLNIVIVKFNFAIGEFYFSLDMTRILEVQFHLCVWIVSTAPSFPLQNSWPEYFFDFGCETLTTLTCWSSRRPSDEHIPLLSIIFGVLIISRSLIRRFDRRLGPVHNSAQWVMYDRRCIRKP
jgi:hypothetical protein